MTLDVGNSHTASGAPVTLATKTRRYWTCPKCSHRNEATRSRKCQGCGEMSRKLKRRPKHAEILRGDTYPLFVQAAREIHGVTDESCCVCGKPRGEHRQDRDHGHRKGQPDYGKPRGLVCCGNQGCNILMLPWVTAATAAGIAVAKLRAHEPDAPRWKLISEYLERAEAFYREAGDAHTGTE